MLRPALRVYLDPPNLLQGLSLPGGGLYALPRMPQCPEEGQPTYGGNILQVVIKQSQDRTLGKAVKV